jgi:hypothetical protein
MMVRVYIRNLNIGTTETTEKEMENKSVMMEIEKIFSKIILLELQK